MLSTKAQRWFWGLVTAAVLDMAWLYRSWRSPAAPMTGLAVAVSGTLLVLLVLQAARVAAALTRRVRVTETTGRAAPTRSHRRRAGRSGTSRRRLGRGFER